MSPLVNINNISLAVRNVLLNRRNSSASQRAQHRQNGVKEKYAEGVTKGKNYARQVAAISRI